jgi:type I restriction enzyme, S subunit
MNTTVVKPIHQSIAQNKGSNNGDFKHTEVGWIPVDWDVVHLGSLVDLLTGYPFPSSKYVNEGVKLLRGSNIKRGNTDWSNDITKYWNSITSDIKRYVLEDGDIVIAMDGSLVGRSFAQLSKKDLPALLLQRVARLRTNKSDINYLKHHVCSPYFTLYCDSVKTASAIPHISPSDISGYLIPLPQTLAEQTAIATALSDMDVLIEAQEHLIAKKRALKQGAMHELIKPKEGWELKSIGDCAYVIGGGTPSSFNSNFWNGSINWFTPTEVGESKYLRESIRKITDEGFSNCSAKMLPTGAILLTSRAGIGDLGILTIEACTNQGFQSLVPKENSDGEFLYYLMQTLKNKLLQNASGSTFLEISPGKLKAIVTTVPVKHEQKRIALILSVMDAEIELLEAELAKIRQLKAGMMQELLTGKKRLV